MTMEPGQRDGLPGGLRGGLRAIAGSAPLAAVPADFYDRAHARTRQRRTVRVAAAVVAVLVLAVGLGLRAVGRAGPAPVGERAAVGLPSRLPVPPWWTASGDSSPVGVTAAMYGGDATVDNLNEGRFAVIAAGSDRVRVFNDFMYPSPGFEGLLSPNGRYLNRGQRVIALDGSRQWQLPGAPVGFSPDSRLVIYETGSGTTVINGEAHTPSEVGVYDLASGAVVASFDNTDRAVAGGWGVAVSPDGTRLAVQLVDQVLLLRLDTRHPTPYATVRLGTELLAGPGSWLPDGRTLVTARREADDRWRLVTRSAETGEVVDPAGTGSAGTGSAPTDPAGAGSLVAAAAAVARLPVVGDTRYLRVLGWRPDGTAVAMAGVPQPGTAAQRPYPPMVEPYTMGPVTGARLVALHPGTATAEVLLTTPAGVEYLDVAADLAVAGVFRAAGSPDYGALANPVVLAGLGAFLLLGALVAWRVRRRRRRRAVDRDAPCPAGGPGDPTGSGAFGRDPL